MSELTPKQLAALNLLEEGREYEEYFFGKAKGFVWFYPLRERGYFSPERNPKVHIDEDGNFYFPHWPVLDYLERVSEDCAKLGDLEISAELMLIIRSVTEAETEENSRNARTWWYFTKIMSNLPSQVIELEGIELIKVWIEQGMGETNLIGREIGSSLLPKLMGAGSGDDSLKVFKVVEIVTEIRWKESRISQEMKPSAAIEAHWLSELFSANAQNIALSCGDKASQLLRERFIQATERNNDDKYSYMWRPAIEEHPQNRRRDEIQDILVNALRDILLSSTDLRIDIGGILENMLQQTNVTPRRIAIFVIAKNYPDYSGLFWKAVSPELFTSEYQHELYELLRFNFGDFSPKERKLVLEIIKGLKGRVEDGEKNPQYDAAMRIDWLHAIKDQGEEEVDQLYRECVELLGSEPDHPDFAAYMEVTWGPEEPIDTGKLLGMPVEDIASYLSEFKQEKGWNEPTEEGLGKVFQEVVSQDPEKFTDGLSYFANTKLIYQYYLICGFKDAWKDQRVIEWGRVLSFCWEIVEAEEFWNKEVQEMEYPSPNRKWITSAVSDLIAAGVRNDEWAFHEKYLAIAEGILLRILEMEESTADPEDTDALSESINTSRGRGIEAFLDFALHCARLEDKQRGNHRSTWERIRPACDDELAKCRNDNYEFSALIGAYLPNMLYLDKDWTLSSLPKIFCRDYPRNWYYTMSGYSYAGTSYKEVYDYLRSSGDFVLAISTDLGNEQIRERVLQHVCLAYLYQGENIDDPISPFLLILKRWQEQEISTVTRFFWGQLEERTKEKSLGRVINYWKRCSERIKGHEDDNRIILSDLTLLTGYLSMIGSTEIELLKQAAPYVNDHHNMRFFLEYLDELCDDNSSQVAEIVLEMLSRSIPQYDEDLTRAIITKLYENDLLVQANKISDVLLKNRVDLRDIYRHYNQ